MPSPPTTRQDPLYLPKTTIAEEVMPKFKCKVCHKKFKVTSMEAAPKEIECFKKSCPIVLEVKTPNFDPRSTDVVEFTDWPPEEFSIITNWETPEPPKPVVYPVNAYSDGDFARQQREMFNEHGWPM